MRSVDQSCAAAVESLRGRFPDVPLERIEQCLRDSGGHAGRAAALLRNNLVQASPAAGAGSPVRLKRRTNMYSSPSPLRSGSRDLNVLADAAAERAKAARRRAQADQAAAERENVDLGKAKHHDDSSSTHDHTSARHEMLFRMDADTGVNISIDHAKAMILEDKLNEQSGAHCARDDNQSLLVSQDEDSNKNVSVTDEEARRFRLEFDGALAEVRAERRKVDRRAGSTSRVVSVSEPACALEAPAADLDVRTEAARQISGEAPIQVIEAKSIPAVVSNQCLQEELKVSRAECQRLRRELEEALVHGREAAAVVSERDRLRRQLDEALAEVAVSASLARDTERFRAEVAEAQSQSESLTSELHAATERKKISVSDDHQPKTCETQLCVLSRAEPSQACSVQSAKRDIFEPSTREASTYYSSTAITAASTGSVPLQRVDLDSRIPFQDPAFARSILETRASQKACCFPEVSAGQRLDTVDSQEPANAIPFCWQTNEDSPCDIKSLDHETGMVADLSGRGQKEVPAQPSQHSDSTSKFVQHDSNAPEEIKVHVHDEFRLHRDTASVASLLPRGLVHETEIVADLSGRWQKEVPAQPSRHSDFSSKFVQHDPNFPEKNKLHVHDEFRPRLDTASIASSLPCPFFSSTQRINEHKGVDYAKFGYPSASETMISPPEAHPGDSLHSLLFSPKITQASEQSADNRGISELRSASSGIAPIIREDPTWAVSSRSTEFGSSNLGAFEPGKLSSASAKSRYGDFSSNLRSGQRGKPISAQDLLSGAPRSNVSEKRVPECRRSSAPPPEDELDGAILDDGVLEGSIEWQRSRERELLGNIISNSVGNLSRLGGTSTSGIRSGDGLKVPSTISPLHGDSPHGRCAQVGSVLDALPNICGSKGSETLGEAPRHPSGIDARCSGGDTGDDAAGMAGRGCTTSGVEYKSEREKLHDQLAQLKSMFGAADAGAGGPSPGLLDSVSLSKSPDDAKGDMSNPPLVRTDSSIASGLGMLSPHFGGGTEHRPRH